MEFTKTNNGFVKYDENGRVIAEITYSNTSNPNVVVADHTFVDSSLRGQGVAGKLLNALVEDMKQQNKKIKASCSYVVKKFEDIQSKSEDLIDKVSMGSELTQEDASIVREANSSERQSSRSGGVITRLEDEYIKVRNKHQFLKDILPENAKHGLLGLGAAAIGPRPELLSGKSPCSSSIICT